ncbi:phasin family protein [Rhodoferax sp.]|uniref:phasin family protein n=1 Tax=Rhodoferax sp. TaxID=50421 RepID=UPI00374D312E
MTKKQDNPADVNPSDVPPLGSVKDSAQQIWLAGLGAFAKAQEEGGKVFETLVKDGLGMQRKSQAIAEEKITAAANKMSSMAQGISERATGQWDKLENIFEDRVAKALKKLGVPSARDIDELKAQVEELTKAVKALSEKPAVPKARSARAAKPEA